MSVMITKINLFTKRLIATLGVLGIICAPAAAITVPVIAAESGPQAAVCDGIGMAGGNCDDSKADSSITNLITNIINIFSWVVGIVAVLMIIFAGFTYVTSAGGDGVKTAKNILIYAVIGLVVVAFAQVIVHFAIGTANEALKTK